MHDLISLQVSSNYRFGLANWIGFLAMGEVLSFGFNLAVLDPSDRKGTDMYCIVSIKDKKMGFISYRMSLTLYIMSSSLKHYSVLMNLIL